MINSYRLYIKGDEIPFEYKPRDGFQVHKRSNGVVVVYRDEANKTYYAVTYPWHTVDALWAYGTLERKGEGEE